MFKLQIWENNGWRTVNAAFRSLIPADCDVMAWLAKQYPGYKFRMAFYKGEN